MSVERGSGGEAAWCAILACLLFVAGCKPAPRSAVPYVSMPEARSFVVAFYAWYWKPDSTKSVDSVMARHRNWLTADLAALVDSDNACVARTRGECRLEEDPFLASQDPCQRYEVGGSPFVHGDTTAFAIFGVCQGQRDTVPAVIALVVPRDTGWQFVNFIYPVEKSDLRTILTQKKPGT